MYPPLYEHVYNTNFCLVLGIRLSEHFNTNDIGLYEFSYMVNKYGRYQLTRL